MRVLLPKIKKASNDHVDVIEKLQEAWTPEAQHLRAKSFPTPFAQAEMMTHVLGGLKLESGGRPEDVTRVNPTISQSFERWELLLLGVVLGELRLETVDLLQPAYDNFGRMMAELREECRFFTTVRDLRLPGPRGTATLVGGTDPECLFWCSPRNPPYWNSLKTRIAGHPQLPDAKALLSEWRGVLQSNNAWSVEGPVWQKAINIALEGVPQSSSTARLSRDSRFEGPVNLELPRRPETVGSGTAALYFPVLSPGWGPRFQELLFLRPIERRPGAVNLEDTTTQRVVARVAKSIDAVRGPNQGAANAASSAGFDLLAGVGRIDVDESAAVHHGQFHWLEDQNGQQGYRSLVVAPLLEAAKSSLKRSGIDEEFVRSFSILFPDALRLVLLGTEPARDGEVRVHLSPHVTARRSAGFALPHNGVPPEAWQPGTPAPSVLALPGAKGGPAFGLVERYGPENRVDVGEIRALGLTLWLYFLGECEVQQQRGFIVWRETGDELFGLARAADVNSTTIQVRPKALQWANEINTRARAQDRRATLFRFALTWEDRGAKGGPDMIGDRIGAIAAQTFVRWVLGDGHVKLFGPRGTAPDEQFTLLEGVRLPLFLDKPWPART
jgi:hypothetical protein